MYKKRPAEGGEAAHNKRSRTLEGSHGESSQARVLATHKMSAQELRELFDPEQCLERIDKSKLVSGEDTRTTLYIGPLPGERMFSAERAVKLLNVSHSGTYDFIFVRYFHSHRHCFVHFKHPRDVLSIIDRLDNKEWRTVLDGGQSGRTKIKVAFWRLQGITLLAKKFRGEGFWHPGSPQSCGELYDNRAVFFYGTGAKLANRRISLPPTGSRAEGVGPLTAFLHGWPLPTDA